jgi:hypothetical protein
MSQQEIQQSFFSFLDQNAGHPTRLNALKSFLDAQPEVQPVADLLPADEIHDRLEVIEVIRKKIAELRPDRPPLNHIQFCYLFGMPLAALQRFAYLGDLYVSDAIHSLGKLTAHCKYNNTLLLLLILT